MIQLVAKAAFNFKGRDLEPGDRFEATGVESIVLRNRRQADYAPREAPKPKRRYRRRDLEAEA